MAASNYLANKLLDSLYRAVAFTPPTTYFVALFTTAPTSAGGGTEVTGGSYARVSLTASTTNISATNGATTTTNPSSGTSGAVSNNAVITFPTPTANWGTVVAMALYDASTSGNLIEFANLTSSQVVNSGNPASFPISSLQLTLV